MAAPKSVEQEAGVVAAAPIAVEVFAAPIAADRASMVVPTMYEG